MNEQKPAPPIFWYLLWLWATFYSAVFHWAFPLILFIVGAFWFHNSPHGEPLQKVVAFIQARWRLSKPLAQFAATLAGTLLVALTLPFVMGIQHQRAAEEAARHAQELQLEQQKQAVSDARAREAAARAAADKAAAEKLRVQEAAREAKEDAARRQKADQDRADRQAQWQAQQQQDQQRRDQEEAQRQQQQRQDDEAREQERRAAQGPYTRDQAENMCRDELAKPYGVSRSAVIQQGSVTEKMEGAAIKNMEFGGQRVWNWEATFNIAGTDITQAVQCTVFENGAVKVGAQ